MPRTYSPHWSDYELIDAGSNKKLERWGDIVTIRPERNAYFKPVLSYKEWEKKAHFRFNEITKNSGEWESLKSSAPTSWQITYQGIVFNIRLTRFKHLGIFPEQRANWDFIKDHISDGKRFLNLFAYTGGASVMAKSAGGDVFHCDSVKQINTWARENMESSGLEDIHWVHDDALKFAQRELKRGRKYDGIIMDPPAFGLGAKKERWKIEDKFGELMDTTLSLLNTDGFLIANTYSPRLKSKEILAITRQLVRNKNIEVTTLAMKTTTGKIVEYGDLTRIY